MPDGPPAGRVKPVSTIFVAATTIMILYLAVVVLVSSEAGNKLRTVIVMKKSQLRRCPGLLAKYEARRLQVEQ